MYRIVPDESIDDQLDALDHGALVAYAEVLALLEISPQSGLPYNEARPDGPMRQIAFGGDDQGLVVYLVLERDREVDILSVVWAG
ncbi:hypothetical protein [Pseudonocardia pini]|uniref:hypothetical protein n=1 Tax=Pseudonocardia pini TaxID=2758030 RepID=UPI0015F091FC|nr:hypothetical protein [Pseudonocardia pini]